MAAGTAASDRKPVLAALPAVSILARRVAAAILLGIVAIWLGINLIQDPQQFVSVFLTGVTVGSIYALVAMGYTLVYGIIELINFAHGDVFMWGAMFSVTVAVSWLGLDGTQSGLVTLGGVAATLLVAMAFCAVMNVTIERLAYKPLRNAPRLAPLITAIGVSFILFNLAAAVYGFNYRSLGHLPARGDLRAGRRRLPLEVADRRADHRPGADRARLPRQADALGQGDARDGAGHGSGADARHRRRPHIAFTFALGGALAGAGGMLYVMYFTQVRYDVGFQLGLFAFTAAVLGGIGNLVGAWLGAMLIALIANFNEGLSWGSPGSDWTGTIVFSILILILVFRPEGLLGEKEADRA